MGIVQDRLASAMAISQSEVSRLERLMRIDDVSVVRLAQMASFMGLKLSAGLHAVGDSLVDRGHSALLNRRSRRSILNALRAGQQLPGSGVILL